MLLAEAHHHVRIPVEEDVNLAVRVSQGSGLDLLLVHGFGEGSYVWSGLSSIGGENTRCCAVDLRGHGDSDWDPAGVYTVAKHVSDILRVIEFLGLHRPLVVGHSLGGELAIEVAKRLEGRCGGLVMVDCSPDVDNSTLWKIRTDFCSDSRVFNRIEEYVESLSAKRPNISPHAIDVLIKSALIRSDFGYALKRDQRLIDRNNWSEDVRFVYKELGSIVCPSYLIRGEASSVLSSRSAARLIGQFRDCQLRVIPGAGHSIMQDNPEFFDATLAEIMLAQRL